MNRDLAGAKLVDTDLVVEAPKLEHLAAALGTDSAAETALLVPFFAATAAGESSVIGPLGLDLSRTLLGGQSFEWHRPFRSGETVHLQVVVTDVLEKATTTFVTLTGEFLATDGELIQRQQVVFIERRDQ